MVPPFLLGDLMGAAYLACPSWLCPRDSSARRCSDRTWSTRRTGPASWAGSIRATAAAISWARQAAVAAASRFLTGPDPSIGTGRPRTDAALAAEATANQATEKKKQQRKASSG